MGIETISWQLTVSGTTKLADSIPLNKADTNWFGHLRLSETLQDADAQALVDGYGFEWAEDFIQA